MTRATLLGGLAVAAAGVAVFGGCLGAGYFADDFALLGAVEAGIDWRAPLPVGTGGHYRPLFLASLLPGDAPRLQHGLSLLLHLANGLLVLAVGRLAGCRPGLATVLALAFLLHPLVVTDVHWLAARSDSLCALLYLGGVLALLGHLRGGGAWLLWLAAVAPVPAALAKETGLTLVVALWAVWLLHRSEEPGAGGAPAPSPERLRAARRALLAGSALTGLLAAALALAFWRHAPGTLSWRGPAGPAGALLVAVNAVVPRIDEFDLRRWGLARPWLGWAGAAAGAALAAGAAVLALRLGGRRGALRLALLAALPAAPLLPLLAVGWSRERLVYLPWAMGLVALALLLGGRPAARQRAAAWAGLALLPLLAWASAARGAVWRENARYLEDACASFREIAAGIPDDLPLLLVTAPFSRAEAPLYSNDPEEALGHCLTGSFGRVERLRVYTGLALAEAGAPPHRTVGAEDRPERRLFRRRAAPGAANLRPLLDRRPGPALGDRLAALRVTEVGPTGDAAAFELRVEPGVRGLVLGLGPDGFRELARYE